MKDWKEIDITEIEGFSIGNAEYEEAGTGCTVILAEPAAVTGLDIRGGAPASREAALLNPMADNEAVNAVLLSGGSAFGLEASLGVVSYLEERGIGFPTGFGVVPIVCESCLFDLGCGSASVRPDKALGYQACLNAGNFRQGNYGAGTGATCGKFAGPEQIMKSGLGAYALQTGDLKVGAIIAANPFGEIVDWKTGTVIAGPHRGEPAGSYAELVIDDLVRYSINPFRTNTAIGVILTNAALSKAHLCKVAAMAHDGYARAICPAHTMYDGDSIHAMTSGTVKADVTAVGILAAHAMAEAITSAARHSVSAYGFAGAGDTLR